MNIGTIGEQIARKYLEERGYTFVRANYSMPYGEIDLIMRMGEEVVFVEVKTRKEGNIIAPNTTLPGSKIARLEIAINDYLQKEDIEEWRLILVAVTMLRNGMAKVQEIPL